MLRGFGKGLEGVRVFRGQKVCVRNMLRKFITSRFLHRPELLRTVPLPLDSSTLDHREGVERMKYEG